jgi:dihydrofolate synthase / folylpolyglutamate synthase
MSSVDFDESVKYLYSLGNEVEAMKLGLDTIRKLLAAFGDPQNNYLKVQVAGTNGKGSVCAFLNSICLEASIETGVFSSPHLISITERIKINGSDIREADFARHATHVRKTAERLVADGELETTPTFFEQVTAIALVTFAEAKVELAILETGLGGRLDATTAANAEIAAITRIDYDHQEYLGDTIEEIAGEKAAIIHEGSRVVIGKQILEAEKIIQDRFEQFGIDAKFETQVRTTCGSGWLNFENDQAKYQVKKLGLLGRHQIENAKIAILLAEELQSHFPITTKQIIQGLENARHPGRLEYQGRYLFDGAHNIGGAKALVEFLDEFELRRITLIFGVMNDKDVGGILEILQPKAEYLILTQPDNERAFSAAELEEFITKSFDRSRLFSTQTVTDALKKADEISSPDSIILITGSLYLVGEAKKILNN